MKLTLWELVWKIYYGEFILTFILKLYTEIIEMLNISLIKEFDQSFSCVGMITSVLTLVNKCSLYWDSNCLSITMNLVLKRL